MKVIKCGTGVQLIHGNIEGMITAFVVRFDKVEYEVSYFDSTKNEVVKTWVNEAEILDGTKNRVTIGFKP